MTELKPEDYISLIDTLHACIRGVELADGSTINSVEVQKMAFGALESVLRRIDFDCVSTLPPELLPPDITVTSTNPQFIKGL